MLKNTRIDDSESAVPCYDPLSNEIIRSTKAALNVSMEEREKIERETRDQTSQLWYYMRSRRITGSKCGRILCQTKKTISLVTQCLYPKPLDPPPASIAWGRQHESVAIRKYISHKKALGNTNIEVRKCGFIVHPVNGWLGASPDDL